MWPLDASNLKTSVDYHKFEGEISLKKQKHKVIYLQKYRTI